MLNQNLIHLVYASKSSSPMGPQDLKKLLAQSRENNEKMGITGLLLYHNESFLQLLEGPQEVVRGLFHETILHDNRHSRVTVLFEKEVPEREFVDWNMGFQNIDKMPSSQRPGFLGFNDQRFAGMERRKESSTAHALLLAFKSSASPTAVY